MLVILIYYTFEKKSMKQLLGQLCKEVGKSIELKKYERLIIQACISKHNKTQTLRH